MGVFVGSLNEKVKLQNRDLVNLASFSRFLVCRLSLLNSDLKFINLFIYAPAHEKDKDEFWNELSSYV